MTLAHANHVDRMPAGPMRAVCSWCDTVIREGREPTSHGICPDCKANVEGECSHRAFTDPRTVRLPSGRTALVASCFCGRSYFLVGPDGLPRRKMEGVKVTLYRRDRAGGERAHGGGPDSSVVIPERKDG